MESHNNSLEIFFFIKLVNWLNLRAVINTEKTITSQILYKTLNYIILLKIQPKTFFVGKNQIFLPSCHSTNDIAGEIIQNKEIIDGTVIFTDHQTAGKGQRGNKWESKVGENLLMSIILKTSFIALERQFDLSITVALSIFEALESLEIINLTIKWPNDIYIKQKKIGGVLIENSILGSKINSSVVGIGINIHQSHFDNTKASSLINEIPEMFFERKVIAEKICEFLEKNLNELKENKTISLRDKYLKNLLGINQLRLFKNEEGTFEGTIKGITEAGQLIVISQNKEKYYNIKEIEHLFDE